MTEQYLDDPEKFGRLGYVNMTPWIIEGVLFFSSSYNLLIQRSAIRLDSSSSPLLCLCMICRLEGERVDLCVGWRVLRIKIERDLNCQGMQMC